MRFLSLCSGIEAASVAWAPLGWKAAAVAEIEAFPSAVLAHHYPDVPNLGDITKFKEWPDLGTIDLICGGTPCQSFSIAGLRKGLADPRGNLSLTFLAIIDRYRPRYVVWENVPGVLSSDGGRDFAAFLGGLGQLGYGWAFRVLDAQHVRVDGFPRAVPQRRRRVFVVGYLGDWRRAAAVLSGARKRAREFCAAPRSEGGICRRRSCRHFARWRVASWRRRSRRRTASRLWRRQLLRTDRNSRQTGGSWRQARFRGRDVRLRAAVDQ